MSDDEVTRLREALTGVWHAAHNPNYKTPTDRLRMVVHILNRVAETDPQALTVQP